MWSQIQNTSPKEPFQQMLHFCGCSLKGLGMLVCFNSAFIWFLQDNNL